MSEGWRWVSEHAVKAADQIPTLGTVRGDRSCTPFLIGSRRHLRSGSQVRLYVDGRGNYRSCVSAVASFAYNRALKGRPTQVTRTSTAPHIVG
jgi:hypothetical protein